MFREHYEREQYLNEVVKSEKNPEYWRSKNIKLQHRVGVLEREVEDLKATLERVQAEMAIYT